MRGRQDRDGYEQRRRAFKFKVGPLKRTQGCEYNASGFRGPITTSLHHHCPRITPAFRTYRSEIISKSFHPSGEDFNFVFGTI